MCDVKKRSSICLDKKKKKKNLCITVDTQEILELFTQLTSAGPSVLFGDRRGQSCWVNVTSRKTGKKCSTQRNVSFWNRAHKQTQTTRNSVKCLEKYGWFIWPYYTSNRIHFPRCQTGLMSMEHGLHPNMNSGITSLQRHIHSLLVLQTVEDTHSKVVIASVKYLVKWVSLVWTHKTVMNYICLFFCF